MPITRPNVFDRGERVSLRPEISQPVFNGDPIAEAVDVEMARGPVADAASMSSADGAAITQALLTAKESAQPIAARSTTIETGQTIRLANYTVQFGADGTTMIVTRKKPEESESLEQQGIPLMDWAQATMRNKSGGPQLLIIFSRLRDEQVSVDEQQSPDQHLALPDDEGGEPENTADTTAAEQESP